MNKTKSQCPYCASFDTTLRNIIPTSSENFLVPELKNITRSWHDCNNCKVCFAMPRLNDKQIKYMYDNYRSESFRNETPDEYFDRITNYDTENSENYHKTNWLKQELKDEWEPTTILDIGCGGGVLLHTLGKIYKNAFLFGIEPTSNFADLASRRTRAKVKNDYFKGKPFKDKIFELVTCCQVLEHVVDLKKFLIDLNNSTRKDGYVYIEVPDISDFTELPLEHPRFSEPSHLWYFSSAFLTNYFESHGFKKILHTVQKTVRKRNNLMILLKKIT